MSAEILKNIIQNFSPFAFNDFFREKNSAFKPFNEQLHQYNNENFTNCLFIGEIPFTSTEKLIIYSFKTTKNLKERSSKKLQYEKGKQILKENQEDAGIFIFYDENKRFRFSLIHTTYVGAKRQWNSFKRYTYFVSPEETNKTFIQRIGGSDFSDLNNIKEAFSVEKVTKEFYQEIANWYFWALKKTKFPKDAELQPNGINIALIRLITRLIFIWFMREKGIIKKELFDKKFLEITLKELSPNVSTYYLAILQNLFFATLNTPIDQRKFRLEEKCKDDQNKDYMNHICYRHHNLFKDPEKIEELFKYIPFLNGGLFECLDKRKDDESNETGEKIFIDGFSDDPKKQPFIPNFLFFSNELYVDLNKDYGTKGKRYKVRGIIDILDSYNFTIDENTPIDEEVALDPELLGRVFENLLASYNPETSSTARKATGSYYTPREIVDYMVNESLKECFKTKIPDIDEEKLNKLFIYGEDTNPFDEMTSEKIINAINNLKLIDPAVGSGAFLMGALHSLVHILHKLDPKNEKWKAEQIKAISHITDPKIKKEILKKIEESFTSNELNYGRKLYLIQNCLYGVDIQPIAIHIAKLRFFISLLVDQKIDEKSKNSGIEPLPNLETRLVAANTLVGLPKSELKDKNLEPLENELNEIRDNYFIVMTEKEKERLSKKDADLRKKIAQQLIISGSPSLIPEKIIKWNPYDTNSFADWFDSKLMLGVRNGFDIVIGNPPHGADMSKYLEQIKFSHKYYDTRKNSASFFIACASSLLKYNGIATYIIPKSLSFVEGWEPTRNFILSKNKLLVVLDISKSFENVLLEQIVIIFKNFSVKDNYIIKTGSGWNKSINIISKIEKSIIETLGVIPCYLEPIKLKIFNKLINGSVKLSSISKTFRGMPWQKKIGSHGEPILRGRDIGRFFIRDGLDKISLKPYEKNKKILGLKQKKIVAQNIVAHVMNPYDHIIIMATLDTKGILTLDTCMNTFITNPKYTYEYILSILNSKLASWYYYWFVYNRAIRTMHFDEYYIGKLPIKEISLEEQNQYIELVNEILNLKSQNNNADTTHLENQIDTLIYKTYGLDETDVKIINNSI